MQVIEVESYEKNQDQFHEFAASLGFVMSVFAILSEFSVFSVSSVSSMSFKWYSVFDYVFEFLFSWLGTFVEEASSIHEFFLEWNTSENDSSSVFMR